MKFAYIGKDKKKTTKEFKTNLFDLKTSDQILAKYVRVYLSNNRQNSAQVKDRGEVSGGGKKPWKQKGTGRARAGSSRSPIWKGGGVTFGPSTDRNYKLKINKKEKMIALATVLNNLVASDKFFVIENINAKKTKDASKLLVENFGQYTNLLLVTDNTDIVRILSNIDKVSTKSVHDVNVYNFASASHVVFTESTLVNYLETKDKLIEV